MSEAGKLRDRAFHARGSVRAKSFRHDLWVSFFASGSLILVVSGGLLVITLELRSGWVSDHQVQMDKGTAIHNLMFRP